MFEYDKFPLIPGSSAVVAIRKENPSPDRASRPSRSPRSFSRLISSSTQLGFPSDVHCHMPSYRSFLNSLLRNTKRNNADTVVPDIQPKEKKDIIPTCC